MKKWLRSINGVFLTLCHYFTQRVRVSCCVHTEIRKQSWIWNCGTQLCGTLNRRNLHFSSLQVQCFVLFLRRIHFTDDDAETTFRHTWKPSSHTNWINASFPRTFSLTIDIVSKISILLKEHKTIEPTGA